MADNPDMFVVFDNAWGKQGCTRVMLKPAKVLPVMEALKLAWETRQKK